MADNNFLNSGREFIVGVGSALVDIVSYENDDFLIKVGAAKGGMTLVSKEEIEKTLALSSGSPTIVPGGSACNTIVGVSRLGGKARFVGKCGSGEMGAFFENDLKRQKVEPILSRSTSPTGRCLSLITPDAQRSMFTFLGASAEALPHEMTENCFQDAAIVHIEGYLLFNPDLIHSALDAAKKAGAAVSLDLASFTVVEESKEILKHIVKNHVNILIANEDEGRYFTGLSDESEMVAALAEDVDIAVLKIGARGSYVSQSQAVMSIAPMGDGTAVDTTGAGDLWAAGFLFGLVNGYPLEKCGQLGSACGFEVCQVIGANIPDEGWERITALLPK